MGSPTGHWLYIYGHKGGSLWNFFIELANKNMVLWLGPYFLFILLVLLCFSPHPPHLQFNLPTKVASLMSNILWASLSQLLPTTTIINQVHLRNHISQPLQQLYDRGWINIIIFNYVRNVFLAFVLDNNQIFIYA